MKKTSNTLCRLVNLFLVLLTHNADSHATYDIEQDTLIRLKKHWHNPTSLSHWTPSGSSHCSWPEITCNTTSGLISELHLEGKGLRGSIPPFICNLERLSFLNLYNNNVVGMFPLDLFGCSDLEYLNLGENYLVGAIPDGIHHLSRLSFFDLSANNFSGNIPASIGRLGELKVLMLQQNQFNGTFPSEIGNLIKLEKLSMNINGFLPSTLPASFTKLRNLKDLWLPETNLIGEIPESIGEMVALEFLDLSKNNLTGEIPNGLFKLKNLKIVYLYSNNLSGEIPQVVDSLELTEVDLSDNNLTGTIPEDFGKLVNLSGLSLFYNHLSGKIPESIGRLPKLTDVRLFSNNLSGPLPPDFGRYSKLAGFQVASNKLTGRLPEYLCSGGSLIGVVAFDNQLEGELPETLGSCSSLVMLRIENNAFRGSIPPGLWTSPKLQYLMITENSFSGELPNKVSAELSRFEISHNRFSGNVPPGIGSSSKLEVLNVSNNLLTGKIPQELTALPFLITILLDKNQLSGSLPSEFISWKSLTTLNLSHNNLSGDIPHEILSLPNLLELDLSNNQFAGHVPSPIGFPKLSILNLSYNHLSGKIPREYEDSAYSNSFLNNPGLCSTSSVVNIGSCYFATSKSSTRMLLLMSLLACAIALSLSVCVTIACHKRKHSLFLREKRNHALSSTWRITPYHRLTFTETKVVTGLKQSNVIGAGGSGKVYKVALDRSNSCFVAVKKIRKCTESNRKLEKEFEAEVEILGRIRHLNIVKLLCCISNDTTKLLVYEYLQNESLYQWLHGKESLAGIQSPVCPSVLDWPKRSKIAIGAARGLSYMHNGCSSRVVHGDVKSSNILLDSEFNAKIGDFGLARLLSRQVDHTTLSAVAGSFGYMAPEFAQTMKVNEKIDIYSFGVVLLELATGKKATSGDTSLADWAWRRHVIEGKPITDALDEEIAEPYFMDEMICVFKLGMSCTSKSPANRPNINKVLETLLHYSHLQISKNNTTEREFNQP